MNNLGNFNIKGRLKPSSYNEPKALSLLDCIKKEDNGIESGSFFNPIVSKQNNYNVTIVDVFNTEELKKQAAVDFKHNLEHVANLVKSLKKCADTLANYDIVSKPLPDYRYCWGIFRLATVISDWVITYFENRNSLSFIRCN